MTERNKVAIVTGAGSGIGKASALALIKNGWRVSLAGRREDALNAALAESGAGKDRALAVATNIADLLFNNAGVGAPAIPLEDLSFEHWQNVVNTNLTGSFLCLQAAFKVMKSQTPRGGRIINNGSISAYAPRPNSIAYTATKHAVSGLTRAASLDGRKYDIAVGQIDIGNALTELAARMGQGVPQANGEIAKEPLMDVQHVADSIVHMANMPPDANVLFMTVMATKMPFVGRG
jgi:NADP-dependent 3-hydroxy acid dehydrogenase YdfG